MAAYSEERFNLRGIETVVQIAGEGDPLVFLHGAGTTTGFERRICTQQYPGIFEHHAKSLCRWKQLADAAKGLTMPS